LSIHSVTDLYLITESVLLADVYLDEPASLITEKESF